MKTDNKDKFLILGTDNFIDEQLKNILEPLKDKDVDRRLFFGDEFNQEDFLGFINTLPLFCDIKISIIKNASKIKNFSTLLKYIKNSESIIAVCDNKADFLSKDNDTGFFKILSEGKKTASVIYSEIRDIFKELDIVLSTESCREIYEMCLSNMKIVRNEFEKLALYYKYKKPENEIELIEKISFLGSKSLFSFIDSFFNLNRKKCLEILCTYIFNNENLSPLFYMISKRLSLIIYYKINKSLVSEREFVLRKISEESKKWNLADLNRLLDKIVEIDYGSKTGKADIKNGMVQLIDMI